MKNSHIEWTTHTFNCWIGCTKVSPGCKNCYAEARDQRFAEGVHWGPGAPRQRTSENNWKQPLAWNRKAGIQQQEYANRHDGALRQAFRPDSLPPPPERPRVFCASLADWLDDEVPIEWLADLLKLIHATPNLDWQLLTKRPQNWSSRIEGVLKWIEARPDWCMENNPWEPVRNFLADWFVLRKAPTNVWIGTTVEDQERADERIPKILEIPARVRFLSCEPLLGALDLSKGLLPLHLEGHMACRGIHWTICGGESGPGARPMHPEWARSLRDQCQAVGVPFFMKQGSSHKDCPFFKDFDSFPDDLKIRQFPEISHVS